MALDQTKLRNTSWNLKIGATDVGGIDEIDLSGLKLKLQPVKCGTAGDMVLDQRVMGLADGASLKVKIRETGTWNTMKLLFPWLGAGTDLVPPVGTLLSTYAAQMILHPVDKGVTTTEDIVLYKCVPIQGYTIKRDGVKDDEFEVEILVLPDASKVGTAVSLYGKVGAP